MPTSIYERIIRLLRLAERATGPEAELALAHAHKLATEHQVDLATMDTSEGEKERKEEFLKDEVEYSEKSLAVYLQWILNHHFRVKTCYNRRAIFIVGRKSDVVFAQYLYGWLSDRFLAEWRDEKKKPNRGGCRRSAKAFFYGMYQELNNKLCAAREETEKSRIVEIAQDRATSLNHLHGNLDSARQEVQVEKVTQSYQLAIVNEKDELQKEYERQFPRVRSRSSSMSYARGKGIAAGRAAGARISIPGLPLNSSVRSSLR